jgi:hypothetical protein
MQRPLSSTALLAWRSVLAAHVAAALLFTGRSALASDTAVLPEPGESAPAEHSTMKPSGSFDQPLAIGAYTLGWAGAYDAAGLGGRARWEFWQRRAGLDLFGEALMVNWPGGGSRHDIPIGFNVYAPFALGSRVRVRAMGGFCAVFSFIEPGEQGAPPSNDVLFGVHGGVGIEVALAGPFLWFLDAQAVWYTGHDRTAQDWSGSVSGSLSEAVVFQPSTGLELAFGR